MEDWPYWLQITITVVVLVGVGIFIIWRLSPILFFKLRAIEVEGRITNWMSHKEKGVTYYYPLVEFDTLEGEKISFRADEKCEGRPMYPIGTKLKIAYDKKDAKNARITYPSS
jgi:hypothetical protein